MHLTQREHEALQELGIKLVKEQRLWDARRKRFVRPNKHGQIPKYSLLKYSILKILEQSGYDDDLVNPDDRLRQQLRQRRTL